MKRSPVRADPVYPPGPDFENLPPNRPRAHRWPWPIPEKWPLTKPPPWRPRRSFGRWSDSHDRGNLRCTCWTPIAREVERVSGRRTSSGKPSSLSWARSVSLPSTAMTLGGFTGWPLRLSPAALLTHGNRLYCKAYLVLQHGSGLTIGGIGFGE